MAETLQPRRRAWTAARSLAVAAFIVTQLFLGADDTPTADETRHLRDGAILWRDGRIETNPEHPPLVKLLSAATLPASSRDAALVPVADPMEADAAFAVRLRLRGAPLLRVRMPVILLSALGLLAFGSLASGAPPEMPFVATLFLAAAPPWLAHAHYVTTDAAPVALLLLSAWAVRRFPSVSGAVLSGTFLGAALLTKFAVPLLAPFALAWIGIRAGARGLLAAVAASLVVLVGVEAYASRGMSAADLRDLSRRAFLEGGLGGPAPASPELDRFCSSIASFSRPLAAYAIGFFSVTHRSVGARGADYWAGRIVTGPQPLYPPETLAFKDDPPLLVASVLGGAAILSQRRRLRGGPIVALLAGLVYLASACRSSLHLGIRHLLPLVVLLAGLASASLLRRAWRIPVLLLLSAHVLVAVFAFPHYVSYRNVLGRLALSPRSAWDLGDDWGQDLGRFLRSERRPVAYLPVLHYRVAEWRRLFPELEEGREVALPCLVDRVALDLLAASSRPDVPPEGLRELAGIRPILDRIDRLRREGVVKATSQPTLLLLERRGREAPARAARDQAGGGM